MDKSHIEDIPSDQALEQLLSQTRALLTEQVDDEAARVNSDLDALLYRVRGSRRASRSALLHARASRPGILVTPPSSHVSSRPQEDPSASYLSSHNTETRKEAPSYCTTQHGSIAVKSYSPQRVSPSRKTVTQADLHAIGIGTDLLGQHITTLDELCDYIPYPPQPYPDLGANICVVGHMNSVEETIQVARHMAMRTPGDAHVILCGAKTLVPGHDMRARSADELHQLLQQAHTQNQQASTIYVVIIDAPAQTHARATRRMIDIVKKDSQQLFTWAVADALEDTVTLKHWFHCLPGGLHPDALAFYHTWDCQRPGHMLDYDVPVGMLDIAPSFPQLWKILFSWHLTAL